MSYIARSFIILLDACSRMKDQVYKGKALAAYIKIWNFHTGKLVRQASSTRLIRVMPEQMPGSNHFVDLFLEKNQENIISRSSDLTILSFLVMHPL